MHPADIPLLLTAEAERSGTDRRALAREVERGARVRLSRGVYVDAEAWATAGETGRHLLRMRALQRRYDAALVFSHWSAAVAHSLPVPVEQLHRLHLTGRPDASARAGLCSHPFAVRDVDRMELFGLQLTGIPRTAVDVAAAAPFRDAVALADAALRRLAPQQGDGRLLLAEAWERAQPRRATGKVARVLGCSGSRTDVRSRSGNR